MIERAIEQICFDEQVGRQMRFIAGPRQVGKTTLTRAFLKKAGCESLYFNWDLRSTKDRFKSDPYFYHAAALVLQHAKRKWICFDEIHKFPKWKDILKVIRAFRNHVVTGEPHGDWTKGCFWVRGQLFARKKVRTVWLVQGQSDAPRVCEMSRLWAGEESDAAA